MKRLFYLSGTLFFRSLTLLVGFHLGATSVEGKKPEQKPFAFFSGTWGLKENGDIWEIQANPPQATGEWILAQFGSRLPVPVSEIAFFDKTGTHSVFVTKSGEGWFDQGSAGWISVGFVPQ